MWHVGNARKRRTSRESGRFSHMWARRVEDACQQRLGANCRVRWLVHLVRMTDERWVKKWYRQRPEGSSLQGRPRNRWQDEEEDLRDLEVRGWQRRELARNYCKQVFQNDTVVIVTHKKNPYSRNNNPVVRSTAMALIITARKIGCSFYNLYSKTSETIPRQRSIWECFSQIASHRSF